MTALLDIRDLHVTFRLGHGLIHPVRGVSLSVECGETLALVGESGCGKTTLARSVLGLQSIAGGQILFNGVDLAGLSRFQMRRFRPHIQCVFQDPFSSLNPRKRVEVLLREPLDVHAHHAVGEWRERRLHQPCVAHRAAVDVQFGTGRGVSHVCSLSHRARVIRPRCVPCPSVRAPPAARRHPLQ